ncbi:hypothetical protein C0Q70_08879 [Pomacea canaliculata]|uniref:PCI domain-containing protein n=2 Tax=Pomacea canaliculata TaxID=400727 RepID=A0A2T7P879_POMCA|nr:hypothetical protein C0Q70_08879 [Pomacea canaliculata]
MHLETRLVQLDSAINMELWQEAFKAVEDIHGLITLSKKQPKPSLMANYYQKLGLVFAKSGNHLFHASTLHRLFNLLREQRKNLSQDELQRMADRLLCATLAIPIPASRNAVDNLLVMDESGIEKQRRLATLLMLPCPPTRQSLVKDLVKYGSLQYVTSELQNLYHYLEVEFHPLQLYPKVQPLVQFIAGNEDLAMYVPLLEDIIITRVLKQVSQVYQTIEFKRFASLVPFADKFKLERLIVSASKNLELQARVDHRSKSLSFGTDLGLSQKEEVAEGPTIQSMPSELIRNQLTAMAQALNHAVEVVGPKNVEEEEELRANLLNSYRLTARKEHQRILQRRQIIEDRKEQLENLNDQREREEQEQVEEARRRAYEAEMARLEREAEERMKQRQQQEHQEIKRKHVRERLEELRKTPQGSKIFQNIDEEEMADLDVDEIMQKQVEQLEKEKRELLERLKGQEKKVDYLARAKRIEEIPLLLKQYEEDKKVGREFWEQQEQERIENLKKERVYGLETKARLSRIFEDSEIFLNTLKKARKSDYEDKLKEFEKNLAVERKTRLLERKQKRKEERRQKWILEKEEEAQRIKDEKLKLEREEQERRQREEREKEEREYAEKIAKLDQQAERQRQREKEIEERQRQREIENRRPDEEKVEEPEKPSEKRVPHSDRDLDWRRGGGGSSGGGGEDGAKGEGENRPWRPPSKLGWREREREKEKSMREDGEGHDVVDRRDAPPPRDFGRREEPDRDFRDKARDFRDRPRDDRDFRDKAPPRDDRGPRGFADREDRGSRGFGEGDERGPRRFDRLGPPREDRDIRGPREERDRDFERGPARDDRDFRGPPRDRDDRDWRSGPRDGPPGGSWRDRPAREDKGDSWRDRGPPREERGPTRDDRRSDDRREDRRGGERGSDSWRDRAPPSRGEERSWRDGPRTDGLRGTPREDGPRGGPRDEALRGGLRDEEPRRGPRDDGPRGGPKEDGPRGLRDDGPRGAPRDEGLRDGMREEKGSRAIPREDRPRGSPRDAGPRAPPKERKSKQENTEDDGWTTVRY